jgi:hypothetical protein
LTTYVNHALVDSSAFDDTVGKRRSFSITPASTSEEHVWSGVSPIFHDGNHFYQRRDSDWKDRPLSSLPDYERQIEYQARMTILQCEIDKNRPLQLTSFLYQCLCLVIRNIFLHFPLLNSPLDHAVFR